MQEWIEDSTRAQQAEGELLAARQCGRTVADYIREFWRLAGKLQGWPEWLLVHHFKTGLDRTLQQDCVYRGLPPHMAAWFQAATELEVELKDDRPRGEWTLRPQKTPDCPASSTPKAQSAPMTPAEKTMPV
ncbi:hypothetical protein E2320_014149 [Naja naja]|nr:hypothetical protein E2320_014149 [Naja naja]